MNELTKTASDCQNDIQYYAAKGHLTCKERKHILNLELITNLALNVLCIAATVVTVVGGAHVFIPIGFGIAALILLAVNIYKLFNRLQNKNEAVLWEPIFLDILQAKYGDAHDKIDAILKDLSKDQMYDLEKRFKIEEPRVTHEIDCRYLHSATIFLQSMHEIVSDQKKSGTEIAVIRDRMVKWGECMRCGLDIVKKWLYTIEQTNFLSKSKDDFSATPVTSTSALLLGGFITQCRSQILDYHFSNDRNAAVSLLNAWSGIDETLHYLNLIKNYEQIFLPKERDLLKNLLKCKTIKEIWVTVKEIPDNTCLAFEQESRKLINRYKSFPTKT